MPPIHAQVLYHSVLSNRRARRERLSLQIDRRVARVLQLLSIALTQEALDSA